MTGERSGGPTFAACKREIRGLHAFFVDWYAGERDSDGFGRLERALAPGFEMVTPDGDRVGREAVIDGIRETYGRYEPGAFDIDIRNVEDVAIGEDLAAVRYEEWQTIEGETEGRISTACFRPAGDAPEGVAWVTLQETWLDR